jgi:uncharacterized protein (DUF1697 family)
MPKYAAFLRGINVGGHKIIKMKDLAEALSGAGYKNVRTYIQSGNVIFESSKKNNKVIEKDLSKLIMKSFGHEVDIMVRTQKEVEDVIKKAPFKKKDSDKKLYVTFLQDKLTAENTKLLKSLNNAAETFHIIGKEIYTVRDPEVQYDKTTLGSFDKKLKVPTTTRNWNVINKITELMVY